MEGACSSIIKVFETVKKNNENKNKFNISIKETRLESTQKAQPEQEVINVPSGWVFDEMGAVENLAAFREKVESIPSIESRMKERGVIVFSTAWLKKW